MSMNHSSIKYRKLVAFDFDHTVVDDNTDIVVRDLVAREKIPDEVVKLYKHSGWIPYMQEIFNILHANGITKSHILSAVETIPEVAGLKNLFKCLHSSQDFDLIIISDSNSEFINYWCKFNGIIDYVNEIYTNPAEFHSNGLLKLRPHHHQLTCTLSSVNLCKGDILEEYMRQQQHDKNVIYEKVFYVGDGSNDICPILRLGNQDYACVRKDYRLHKEITNDDSESQLNLEANLLVWSDGNELMDFILKNSSK